MKIKLRKTVYNIPRFYLFIAIVFCIKIVLMGLFSSDYQNNLFMRFITGFLERLREGSVINPYEFFRQEPSLFPYPPVMLIIESIGGIFSFATNSLFLKNILFKLPNLLFDCLGMYYLMKMFPGKRRYIAAIYFASPIIIYSTYMHGQLDIIPTSLLIMALAYLTSSKYRSDLKYIIFLAAAIASKLHILAVIPILFLFIAKRDGWGKAFLYKFVTIGLVIACILPFWGQGFLNNVLLNNEQSILTKITVDYANIKIYIPILAISLIYLHVFTIHKINKDLLYSLCGILFSVFLVLIPPMPGWYVWIVPFITIYFIDVRSERYINLIIYALLNLTYLLYFLFAHRTVYVDLYFLNKSMIWLKTENPIIINGLFTLLTAILLYSIYLMYRSGIASNSLYKRRNLPFTIGVSGDSGSGKSTLISVIRTLFHEKSLLLIEGDGDHKWERGDAMWERVTHLNPKSNYLYRQAQDLSALRSGQNAVRVDYNHDIGRFTNKYKIKPKPYIVLCGLHSLYLPQARKNLDLKIYMDIDETLRRYWKIQRDVVQRGYNYEEILEQITSRISDAEKYIYPQKKYADLLITYFDRNLKDCFAKNHTVSLSLKVRLDIDIDLEPLIQRIEQYGIIAQYDYDDNIKFQSIIFDGEELDKSRLPVAAIADEIIPHLDEIINQPLCAKDDIQGILEIILLLLIGRKLQGDDSYV